MADPSSSEMTGGCAFNGALDIRLEERVSNDHEPIIMATARDWDSEREVPILSHLAPRGQRFRARIVGDTVPVGHPRRFAAAPACAAGRFRPGFRGQCWLTPVPWRGRGERPQSASEMTNDVAARNAIGVASAGREISSALCTAWAMSNRNSRRLPAIGQRALMARPLSAVQKEA